MNINFEEKIALVTGAGKGKRAIVTGAGKGIGRCIALKLSELGAKVLKVFAISRTESDLYSLKEEVVAKGIIARKGSGAIVNVSSISGFLATPGYPIYCTTKAAMDMLTKSMALEFGPLKIRVNSCNPSGLLTPMGEKLWTTPELKDVFTGRIPMGRFIGIGRCIALRLSKLGAKVYAVSRTQADLDSLKVEDPSIKTLCLDIGNWKNTRKVIEDVGKVDLLVNNAGIIKYKSVLETTEELIDEHFEVNVKAALNISQIVAKGIISRKGSGAIVNISSICGILAMPGCPVYCSSKAAIDMLTKSMALEFGPFKIRVNSCNPGAVLTPMNEKVFSTQDLKDSVTGRIPMGRFIEQEEVANTVAFLLSDYASMINGALVPVDGGNVIHISPNPVH